MKTVPLTEATIRGILDQHGVGYLGGAPVIVERNPLTPGEWVIYAQPAWSVEDVHRIAQSEVEARDRLCGRVD